MVCISPGSLGERLIRTARRLADELNADWSAIYVETPGQTRISQEQRDRLERSLRLAEELGAKTIILPGQSVAETVIDYAHRHNVTKIIAGKPKHSRWREVLRRSEVDHLLQLSGSIDVYIISSEVEQTVRKTAESWYPHRPWIRYLWGLALVIAATGLSALVAPLITPTNLVVVYLLSVVVAAVYLGRGPAILVSVLDVLVFDFFFIPPHLTLVVSDTEYLLTFVGLLVVGLVISH